MQHLSVLLDKNESSIVQKYSVKQNEELTPKMII